VKIKLARWYVALAVRVPGHNDPLCVGFGLDRYRDKARDVALMLAAELAS
jgi:hypothetical protein